MRTETLQVNKPAEQKYKKPGFFTSAGAVLAGSTVSGLTKLPHAIFAPKIMERVKNINTIGADELVKVTRGIDTTLTNTGLSSKGVKILRDVAENSAEIKSALAQEIQKGWQRFMPAPVRELFADATHWQVKLGNNAFYAPVTNKVIMPAKDLALTTFHELGHAANANLSTAGKILQKCRPVSLLAVPIALIALFKTKKAPNQEAKGTLDKSTDFIKNNAGKLTFLTFIPILVEEAMASIKGVNFAKKVLDPSLVQKLAKANKLAYLTYLSVAALSAAGIALGVKVKDSIAKPKPVKQ